MGLFTVALFLAVVLVSVLARERAPILNTVQSTRRASKFAQTRTSPVPGSTPTHLNSNFGPLRDRVEADNKKRERNSQRYEEYKKKGAANSGDKSDRKAQKSSESAAEYVDRVKTAHFKNSNKR
jgi:3-deoxy-D-arabino-heptulosonate 7-phosphate (DAHP) synthase class II